MEFAVDVSRARELEAPTERELRILREEVDPQRLILG
jgi:glutaconate CoA-transferase subunit B